MITLYGFKTIFPEGIGETGDLRAQWALEESGLPYRVHGIDHTAGEHLGEAFIPGNVQGRTRVVQWCFAAVATVDPTLLCLDVVEIFDAGNTKLKTEVKNLATRWLTDVERRLEGREWIACDAFTVADIMMAGVLRNVRKTDLLRPYPRITAYYERCFARPAWQRTLGLYAERLGVRVDDIR